MAQDNRLKYEVDSPELTINNQTVEIVNDVRLSSQKGITLKQGVIAAIDGERVKPDITISIQAPKNGLYIMSTYALTDAEGDKLFSVARTKFESLFSRLQFDNKLPIKRVVAVPWIRPRQTTGRFQLTENKQELKVWLPKGVILEFVEFRSYVAPKIPESAKTYIPKYLPPISHPRLWITEKSLSQAIDRITKYEENLMIWEELQKRAKIAIDWKVDYSKEVVNDVELEKKCREKAFYYLVTRDEESGKEVVGIIDSYLSLVSFGNLLDVTRSIGQTIYTTSLVYDWCYPLLTTEQKNRWGKTMMSLAERMEVGWPPFAQSIVNGHGNEAQINRDLLSMAITISDEFPESYKYCSYAILEQSVPMKRFEFQSPRHPQGVNYGAYRLGWELHAALLFKLMLGKEVYDPNIKELYKYWTYMRTPDGQMLRDADGFGAPSPGSSAYYWRNPLTMFLAYAYSKNAYVKSEFIKQGGSKTIEPYLFLLLNSPEIKPNPNHNLPLTIDFGDVSGSMIARTGWDSHDDVLVEIKGGGFRNGAHQHPDAGAIQLYYRGFQFGDIGQYHFSGTPYDINFNRRSISHSTVLVYNPKENFGAGMENDGGQRFNRPFPKTPEEAQITSNYNNGKVVSASFGPSSKNPVFSYFSADISATYSSKVRSFVRSFCFINTNRKDIPGIVILSDDISSSNSSFKKYWQINTHNLPIQTAEGLILENRANSSSPIGKTHINMLIPAPADRTTQILDGKAAFTVNGVYFEPPNQNFAEKNGKRTLISPNVSNLRDRFLTVFQISDELANPLPIEHTEISVAHVIKVDNKIVLMSNNTYLIDSEIPITIPNDKNYQLAITGLKEGQWSLLSSNRNKVFDFNVEKRKNSIFIETIPMGSYTLTPKVVK